MGPREASIGSSEGMHPLATGILLIVAVIGRMISYGAALDPVEPVDAAPVRHIARLARARGCLIRKEASTVQGRVRGRCRGRTPPVTGDRYPCFRRCGAPATPKGAVERPGPGTDEVCPRIVASPPTGWGRMYESS